MRIRMESASPEEVNTMSIWDRVERCGVIAVLVIDDAARARPLAEALLAGGVDAMELTLRTDAALGALKIIRREVPDMLAGIGTILTPEQVEQVVEADGAFGVAPGCNPRVVRRAQELGLPFAPGIATASDIEGAVELGCRQLKFFPAEPTGGMSYLKSVMAPYAHLGLKYVPLGGLNAQNMTDYLSHPAVPAVGGSWIAKRDLIQNADWAAITECAAEARRIIDDLRKK
jgi:2-dehydro-3-deoxyphosphogluconate aldolase/(4S)-4-hydroxy-2-oxoglutarate aldolase